MAGRHQKGVSKLGDQALAGGAPHTARNALTALVYAYIFNYYRVGS